MNQQPPRPRPLTKEQIAILSRHAAERAELAAAHHNERCAMEERQTEEVAAASAPVQLVPARDVG